MLKSALGAEIIRTLTEDLHDNLIREAEAAPSQETAYGLLKEAAGVIKSLRHLQSIAALPVAPEDGSDKH